MIMQMSDYVKTRQVDKFYNRVLVRLVEKPYETVADINNSDDAISFVAPLMREFDTEHFMVLLLNNKNQVISFTDVSVGSINGSYCHPREVFKAAILANAASLIVAHNHPSGNAEPSKEDIDVTLRLKECGEIIGIKLLDHIIIGDICRSFKQMQLI